MTTPLIILAAGLFIFFYFYRGITQKKVSEKFSLENKKQSAQNKYEFMVGHRRSLKEELADKERQLQTLRNSQEGIKTISASDLDISDVSDDEKVSRYLIQEGKISLEQNEKVLNKMDTLQMDFLGTCLTLGFIDAKTAQKAIKINKVASHLKGLG